MRKKGPSLSDQIGQLRGIAAGLDRGSPKNRISLMRPREGGGPGKTQTRKPMKPLPHAQRSDQWGSIHSSTPGHGGLGVGDKTQGTWKQGRKQRGGLSGQSSGWQRT